MNSIYAIITENWETGRSYRIEDVDMETTLEQVKDRFPHVNYLNDLVSVLICTSDGRGRHILKTLKSSPRDIQMERVQKVLEQAKQIIKESTDNT